MVQVNDLYLKIKFLLFLSNVLVDFNINIPVNRLYGHIEKARKLVQKQHYSHTVYRRKGAYQFKTAFPEPIRSRKGAYQLKTSLAKDSDIKR